VVIKIRLSIEELKKQLSKNVESLYNRKE